jgi:hypothetical protein
MSTGDTLLHPTPAASDVCQSARWETGSALPELPDRSLTMTEAQDWLDWLEATGCPPVDLTLDGERFRIAWK